MIKIGDNRWVKIKERAVLDLTDNRELYAMFPINIDFDNSKIPLEIAFCFPYKHEEMLDDIAEMEKRFARDRNIFIYKEILIKSYEGFDIPCLTISSHHLK